MLMAGSKVLAFPACRRPEKGGYSETKATLNLTGSTRSAWTTEPSCLKTTVDWGCGSEVQSLFRMRPQVLFLRDTKPK